MKRGVKKLDIFIGFSTVVAVSICLLNFPYTTTKILGDLRDGIMNKLTPFYLWLGCGILIYCIYLCFSHHGKVRLGDGKPEYSTISWLTMIFCTGMGSNLLYWSAIEWIYYYEAPPLGAIPFSQQAAELAVTYGGFHWGMTGWAIYAIGAVTLGLRYYCKKLKGLSLADSCCRAFGRNSFSKRIDGIIEIIFLFGTIGGYTTMIAFVIPMYCNNISLLFGIKNTITFQVILMIIITIIVSISACSSIEKGIKKISNINVIVAVVMVLGIFLLGPTSFIIKSATNSFGIMIQNYVSMSLWTDPIINSGFPESWTGFYWAWWIGLAPSMWIFTAKISKGRTVREIILGTILSGSAGCWLYFSVISNYGMNLQLSGVIDFVSILETLGTESAVSQLVLSLPYGRIWIGIWTLTGIIFLITTMDSGAYTLAVSTTVKISTNEQPPKALRLFWAVMLILLPMVLMYAGASIQVLQASAILTAVPIGFITVFTMISGYLYLKEDTISEVSIKNTKKQKYTSNNTTQIKPRLIEFSKHIKYKNKILINEGRVYDEKENGKQTKRIIGKI